MALFLELITLCVLSLLLFTVLVTADTLFHPKVPRSAADTQVFEWKRR